MNDRTDNNKKIDPDCREFREGMSARLAGFSGWANPYKDKRTSASINWQAGWTKANREPDPSMDGSKKRRRASRK